jgi:hypothetical protein
MHYYLSHSRVPVENVLLCFSRSVLIERRATEFKLCPPPPYFLSINFSLRRCVDSCYRSCLLRSDGQTFDCSVSSVSYGLYPPALACSLLITHLLLPEHSAHSRRSGAHRCPVVAQPQTLRLATPPSDGTATARTRAIQYSAGR